MLVTSEPPLFPPRLRSASEHSASLRSFHSFTHLGREDRVAYHSATARATLRRSASPPFTDIDPSFIVLVTHKRSPLNRVCVDLAAVLLLPARHRAAGVVGRRGQPVVRAVRR